VRLGVATASVTLDAVALPAAQCAGQRGCGEQAQRQRAEQVVRGFAETGRLNAVRVSSGLNSQLDLVDNDVRLLDARLTATNLAAEAARQRVALVLALGGGFSAESVQP